jgi:hypothetical protein
LIVLILSDESLSLSFLLLLVHHSPFPLLVIRLLGFPQPLPSHGSTRDQLVYCFSAAGDTALATNRALAATGSEISLAALLLIISRRTCTPSCPASPPPHHYYIPLSSVMIAFGLFVLPFFHLTTTRQRSAMPSASFGHHLSSMISCNNALYYGQSRLSEDRHKTSLFFALFSPYSTSPTIEHCLSKNCHSPHDIYISSTNAPLKHPLSSNNNSHPPS